MRIRSLRIDNLRAIDRFAIDDLGDFIIIAGPNGCGKTTVLDALRLLKSAYVADEWKRWLQEFGIHPDRPTNFHTLFRDPAKAAHIAATIEISEQEATFLRDHALNIAVGLRINEGSERKVTITGDSPLARVTAGAPAEEKETERDKEIAASIAAALAEGRTFNASVQLTTQPRINVTPSPLAEATFSCFSPDHLGEVEFHTSRRFYAREAISSVSLNLKDRSEERKNRFLYDLENKYKNVKSQLSEEYISAVLRNDDPDQAPLQKSLKELFVTFFPGKAFLGVTLGANNSLSFPVRLDTGETHDIDELSSGEKEIVYGYLWLRTGTPRGSVVLVDEPELHLNPALIQGLPAFYKTNLADALNAQVWIVTHSDAILRQGVRAPGIGVYHMSRPRSTGEQQAIRIDSTSAIEAAVIDLIGDLAAYRPHAKIILVEGHKETRFDVDLIRRLFPDFAEKANFIPVGNRRMTAGVRIRLLEVLEEAGLAGRAASISDGDLGLGSETGGPGQHQWPVYEIENFLLDSSILRSALAVLLRHDPYADDTSVANALQQLAADLVPELALNEVQYILNGELMNSIRVGANARDPLSGLRASCDSSRERLVQLDLTDRRLKALLDQATKKLEESLRSGRFLQQFPGDRLLRGFAGLHGILGDHFRNACLDAAQRMAHRPEGMLEVLKNAIS